MDRPVETEEARKQREREREAAEAERRAAGQRNAASLTSDYRAVYRRPSLVRTS